MKKVSAFLVILVMILSGCIFSDEQEETIVHEIKWYKLDYNGVIIQYNFTGEKTENGLKETMINGTGKSYFSYWTTWLNHSLIMLNSFIFSYERIETESLYLYNLSNVKRVIHLSLIHISEPTRPY